MIMRKGFKGSRFKVQGSRFKVQGSGFRVQGSGFRVQGCGGSFAAITYEALRRFEISGFLVSQT